MTHYAMIFGLSLFPLGGALPARASASVSAAQPSCGGDQGDQKGEKKCGGDQGDQKGEKKCGGDQGDQKGEKK